MNVTRKLTETISRKVDAARGAQKNRPAILTGRFDVSGEALF